MHSSIDHKPAENSWAYGEGPLALRCATNTHRLRLCEIRTRGSAKIRVKAATADNGPLPAPLIRFNQRPVLHNPYLLSALR
jgi:hypothetical protein